MATFARNQSPTKAKKDIEEVEIVNTSKVYDRSSESEFKSWLKKNLKSEQRK